MPPVTKTKSISIQTLIHVIFDLHTKPCQFRSLQWNQVNSDPPHWNQVYFDHLHNNQVNFIVNTKTMSFSAHVILRVIHTGTCSCDTAAIRMTKIPILHTKIKSISTTYITTKATSLSTLKPCHFRRYFACYTYRYMFLWYSSNTYDKNYDPPHWNQVYFDHLQ